MNDTTPICPQCGLNDQVRSLPLIVAEEGTGPLVRTLAPPPKPALEAGSSWAKVGSLIFIGGGIISILATLFVLLPAFAQGQVDSQVMQLTLSMVFGLGIIAGGLATMRANAKKAEKKRANVDAQLARWDAATVRWQRLHYCARDEGIFDPDENILIPATEMIAYVER